MIVDTRKKQNVPFSALTAPEPTSLTLILALGAAALARRRG